MGACWSVQDFRQAGLTPSEPGAFFLFYLLALLVFADLNCRCGGEGVVGDVNVFVEKCPERVCFFFSNL